MTLARIVVWGLAIITIFLLISSLFKLNDDVRSAMQATQLLTETLLWVVVTLGLSYAVTSIITEIQDVMEEQSNEEGPANPSRRRRRPRQRSD